MYLGRLRWTLKYYFLLVYHVHKFSMNFLRNLQNNSKNKMSFHLKKADWSKHPGRRDFNSLFVHYCHEKFGSRNSAAVFSKLEKRIN